MKNKIPLLIIAAETLIIFFLSLIIIVQLSGISLEDKIVFQSIQPKPSLFKEDSNTYCVTVINQHQILTEKYTVLIHKQIEPGYGHAISYLDPCPISNKEIGKSTKVKWLSSGVEIEMSLGDKVFIPTKNIIGGR